MGIMSSTDQHQAQHIILHLLEQFDAYCTKHNLRYTLVWGTLIGAIRHQGFIPWDNDVDLAMPRSDYEHLLQLIKTEPISSSTTIVNRHTDPSFMYSVSRVISTTHPVKIPYLKHQPQQMSPWLDIFPFDAVPKSPLIVRNDLPLLMRLAHIVQGPMMYAYPSNSIDHLAKKFLGFLVRPFKSTILSYIDKTAQQYVQPTPLPHQYACLVERCGKIVYIDKDSFEHPMRMPFEHLNLPVMQNYHEWLTDYYGDYLTVPPLEQREVHDFEFIDNI